MLNKFHSALLKCFPDPGISLGGEIHSLYAFIDGTKWNDVNKEWLEKNAVDLLENIPVALYFLPAFLLNYSDASERDEHEILSLLAVIDMCLALRSNLLFAENSIQKLVLIYSQINIWNQRFSLRPESTELARATLQTSRNLVVQILNEIIGNQGVSGATNAE